ncbi:hypothetical protein JXJ21_03805 [candidate division KSB1 bacterium]|nr:hypothetical protein [candidate division KSB1 bacterium]
MRLIEREFELCIQLLSSIWLRKPILINRAPGTHDPTLLEELLSFVPEYRQLIFCGDVPRNMSYHRLNLKVFGNESIISISETLRNLFYEEKSGRNYPLLIVYFNADYDTLETISRTIDRGWIAITSLSQEDVKRCCTAQSFDDIVSEAFSVHFLIQKDSHVAYEQRLLEKIRHRSRPAMKFLLQKKFSEARYACEAMVDEIEVGHRIFHQEMLELFEMDALIFEKSLQILAAERYLDIKRYIDFPPENLGSALRQISKLNGVVWTCLFENSHLIGFEKNRKSDNLPINSLIKFYKYIESFAEKSAGGRIQRLIVKLLDGYQLIILNLLFTHAAHPQVVFILAEPDNYSIILIKDSENILERNAT